MQAPSPNEDMDVLHSPAPVPLAPAIRASPAPGPGKHALHEDGESEPDASSNIDPRLRGVGLPWLIPSRS